MARKLEFDRDQALDQALKLFWQRGYAATSLPELLDVMQIARSSFYSSFTDKRTLFLECLDRFGERTCHILTAAPAELSPLGKIRHFFEQTIVGTPRHRLAHGCMMVNTVLELAEVEPELKSHAQRQLDAVQRQFERLLNLAVDCGQLSPDRDTEQLAEVLMTLNLGIRVQSRKLESPEAVADNINHSLELLGLAA
mgnify:CR=1 FL=1